MRDRISADLLAWYDRHARILPWRVGPAARAAGTCPDPYRVWLSEIMLQQTTVAVVGAYFTRFVQRWPDVAALAAADEAAVMAEWAGLGYYSRARNLLACARQVAAAGGFPNDEAGLRALPGIGPYTAAAIAAIAFDRPANVVDGNVERVVARLFAITTPLPAARRQLREQAATIAPRHRPGDHAQALMDLGATICTPRRPDCPACPLAAHCAARLAGIAAELPRRSPRPPRPQRYGTAYVARRADGAWLLERRPPSGLLGGTSGWPGGEWVDQPTAGTPPLAAEWRGLNQPVQQVFTHFRLELAVAVAWLGADAVAPAAGAFFAHDLDPATLPGVMRKVWAAAAPHLGGDAATRAFS